MSQENVEITRRGFEHFIRTGDVLVEVYDPEVVMDTWADRSAKPSGGVYVHHGVEAMRAFLTDWVETWDDWEFEVEELHDAGNKVVSVVRQRGRSKASGVPVDMKFAFVITFRDGKQLRVDVYFDRAEALEAARA
jgi:ketosteroid isomerase-like protein